MFHQYIVLSKYFEQTILQNCVRTVKRVTMFSQLCAHYVEKTQPEKGNINVMGWASGAHG
jgi:hypothetical protein